MPERTTRGLEVGFRAQQAPRIRAGGVIGRATYHSAVIRVPGDRGPLPSRAVAGRAASILAVLAMVAAIVGCGGGSFDPDASCTADGRAPGAYPELEALVPATFEGRSPDRLDSGRNCSATALGTLAAGGIDELRFAGGIWDLGASGGVTLAVLEADGLDASAAAAFYEAGARAGRKVESVERSAIPVGGLDGARIDALNDESFQTVVVVPGDPDRVWVVIVASAIREVETREAHDSVVTDAIAAAFGEPQGTR